MGYDKEILLAFLDEVSEYIPQLRQHFERLSRNPKDRNSLEEAYRLAHSIKGSASMLELEEMRLEAWNIEQALHLAYEKKEKLDPAQMQQLLNKVAGIDGLIGHTRAQLEGKPLPGTTAEPSLPPVSSRVPAETANFAYFPPERESSLVLDDQPTRPGSDFVYPFNEPEVGSETLEDLIFTFTKPPELPQEQPEPLDFDLEALGLDFRTPPEPFQPPTQNPPGGYAILEEAVQAEPTLSERDQAPLLDFIFDEPEGQTPVTGEQFPEIALPASDTTVSTNESAKNFPYPEPAYEPGSFPYPSLAFEPVEEEKTLPEQTNTREELLNLKEDTGSFRLDPVPGGDRDISRPPHELDPLIPGWLKPEIETNPQSIEALLPEFGLPEHSRENMQAGVLDEILFTETIDDHIDRLQAQIRPHLNGDPQEFDDLPLPEELASGDMHLLASLEIDLVSDSELGLNALETTSPGPLYNAPPNHEPSPEYHEASSLFSDLENGVLNENTDTGSEGEEPPLIGMTAQEEAAVQQAIKAFQQGNLEELGEQLSEEELAALGGMDDFDFGFDPGPLFLAEAQSDLNRLDELTVNFTENSIEEGEARKVSLIASTMRKAAEMMNLEAVAQQLMLIEGVSGSLDRGELPASKDSVEILKTSVTDLQFLLEPYRQGAEALVAGSDAEPDRTEFEAAFAVEETSKPGEQAQLPDEEVATFGQEKVTTSAAKPPVQIEVDPEFAEVFAGEAEEHIASLDANLGRLEREPDNRELVREIRRTAHTLKGSAAMVGFNVISQTAHLMEDLLDRLYDGSIEVDGEVVELLFTTFNQIEATLRRLKAGKPENPEVLETLKPRYAALFESEAEEVAEGGAIIFKPRVVEQPAPSGTQQWHAVNEDEIAIMEAEQAQEMAAEQAEITQTPAIGPLEVELAVRVPIKRLNEMMNQLGEMVISRTSLEQNSQVFNRIVEEMNVSLKRLQRLTHELETRYEVELLHSGSPVATIANGNDQPVYNFRSGNGERSSLYTGEFDTLEMDRYTEFHQLSREMSETVADLSTMQRDMEQMRNDFENLIIQQGRITDDLQDKVVNVRLVPLSNLTPRLYRVVRTISTGEGKEVQFVVSGDNTQVDKTIFEEIGDPLLHLIRNAVDHAIEMPDIREMMGKPRQGTVTFAARSEGTQVIIEVRDDGTGIDTDILLQKGLEKGLLKPGTTPTTEELYNLMFMPGFSTSNTISEISGRGVGLDVVQSKVSNLKGVIEVESEPGKGTAFIIRLPSTLTITRAILVRNKSYTYAIPLSVIERTARLDAGTLENIGQQSYFRPEGEVDNLPLINLSNMLHLPPHLQPEHEEDYEKALADRSVLILAGNERYALEVDSLVGQQEVVIKDLGSHLKTMPGLLGATILGNGQVVLILNIYELMLMAGIRTSTFASGFISGAVKKQTESPSPARLDPRKRGSTGLLSRPPVRSEEIFRQRRAPLIQVVDDSLSVRKVLSGMLEKAGFRVRTSKDGQEALETIHQQNAPDLFIMDIEMPRMDGYELTGIIKNSPHYRHIPVVMLTSRAGPKHRQKAEEVGADGFLVKPYKEEELLQIVGLLLSQSTRTN